MQRVLSSIVMASENRLAGDAMAGNHVEQGFTESAPLRPSPRAVSEPAMKTFIRVAEIWVPTEDGSALEYLDGLYGPLDQFRQMSERMRFAFDQGLPGKAWASGHPIILKELDGSYFNSAEASKAAGLTCGVALPVLAGDRLSAVVAFFCGDDEAHVGAIELWHNDPDVSYEMRLVDGYYGTAGMFEFNSRYTRFPRGFGLPGRAWKSNMPMIVKDLYRSKPFLRWQQAMEVGINRGLGIPYPHASGHTWVMTFLSARDTPLARRFEIWVPNQTRDALIFHSGDCDQNTRLEADYASARIGQSEGTIGEVWRSGTPAVRASMAGDASAAGRSATAAGLDTMLAVPIFDQQGPKAIVVWYF
jgi:hypothetical protein